MAIVECAKNIIIRNVELKPHQLRLIQRHRKQLQEFVKRKTTDKRKVEILQSGTGLLSTLLGPIIQAVGGIFKPK